MSSRAVAIIILVLLFVQCRQKDDHVPLEEAYNEITISIATRAKRCGHEPGYPLILPGKPPEYGLRLCSLLILQGECPFHDYPLPCLEMYNEVCDSCDVPGFSP